MTLIDTGSLIAGRYQLSSRLDTSGRAQVWRASDRELGREVAVKILLTPTSGDPTFLDGFRAQAQLEARMHHPGIVEVYDWGHDGGANYVVMELLEGLTVRQLLRRGPMLPERAVAVCRQTAAALAHAHAQGVAHGSVGPDHVMVSPEGHATLIDFGLQCRGACEYSALPDADTYALGTLLYTALVGVSPIGPRPADLPERETWPAPARRMNASVSADLDTIVMKAISPNPSDRYQRAADLQAALEMLSQPKSRTWLWVAIAATAVLVALAGAWFFTVQSRAVVPDLVGLSTEQAQAAVSSAGLKMVVTGRVPSPDLPADAVVSEEPSAGVKVRRGSQVAVTVSTGKPTATVPSLAGTTLREASSLLTNAGLTVGKVTTNESSAFPTETVISQDPAAGAKVTATSKVDLVVSAGRTMVTMPDVRGMTEDAATTKLEGLEFVVDAGTTFSSRPAGEVVAQGPAAGTAVAKGATVTISVSKGDAPVTVPDVVGALAGDARASLQKLGLVPVSVLTSGTASQVGRVISQTPAAGRSVSRGGQVEIDIGK